MIDDYFSDAPTLEQVLASVSPEFIFEIAAEAARSEAHLDDDDGEEETDLD
jgi:hypothetical protein